MQTRILLRKSRTNSGRYRVRVIDFFGRFRVHHSVGIGYGGVNRELEIRFLKETNGRYRVHPMKNSVGMRYGCQKKR